MTPITGPATLPRRIAKILATARRARRPLGVPTTIDGDRLFAYWENTLDADERREVEDQARTCDECRRWLEEIGELFASGERGVSMPRHLVRLTAEPQRKNAR